MHVITELIGHFRVTVQSALYLIHFVVGLMPGRTRVQFNIFIMPRKQKGKRFNRRSAKSISSGNTLQTQTFTFRTREVPLRITQATSGTGGLTTVTSGGSYTNANLVPIDPFNIGGRFNSVASNFTKYQLLSVIATYIPDSTQSGVTDLVAGPSTTPTYVSRSFAWGFNRDPALSTLSYTQLIEMGGQYGNTSRPQKLRFSNNRDPYWYFVSTTAASPTTIDLRMAAPLQLRFAYSGTSTTAIGSYGHVVMDFVIKFQGSIAPNGSLGLTMPSLQNSDESKEEKPKGWFQ